LSTSMPIDPLFTPKLQVYFVLLYNIHTTLNHSYMIYAKKLLMENIVRGVLRYCLFLCAIYGVFPFLDKGNSADHVFADDFIPGEGWEIETEKEDLANIILDIAMESYPGIDKTRYLEQLEEITETIKASVGNDKTPEHMISTINTILFHALRFQYVQTGNLEHVLLNKVLDNKSGNCVGLSLLYLCIAQKLQLPIYGVSVPEHMFVRYSEGNHTRNIETGYNGLAMPDRYYMNIPGKSISQKSIKNGYYLKNLTIDEVLSSIYLNRSLIQKEYGNIKDALIDVNKAVELRDNDAVAFCNRGVLHEKLGNNEQAIADYNRAIDLNPDYAPAYYNRGSYYANMEKIDNAIMDYNRAILLDPNSKLAHYNRGMAFYFVGKVELAIQDLSTVIAFDPEYAPAYATRGLAYAESNEPEKALKDFNKALELDPGNVDVYMKRSILHADAMRYDEAIRDITAFIQSAPENVFAYYIRAKAYRGSARYRESLEDFNKMIELKPGLAGAYYERALVKKLLGMPSDALADLNVSIELFPYNPLAYLHRANTYRELELKEKALKDYLIYLKLNPDAPDADEVKKDIESIQSH